MLTIGKSDVAVFDKLLTKVMLTGLAFILVLVTGIGAGYAAVSYGNWVDDNIVKLVLLPLVFVFLAIFLYDKRSLFLLVIAVRIPIDPLIEASRQASALSPGALMNAFVLFIALLLFLERPQPMLKLVIPLWLPLIVIIIFEFLRAPDRSVSFRSALSYSTNVAVFAIPFYLKQCQKDMKFAVHLVLLSSLLPVFFGFIDLARGGYSEGRISSMFPHPNLFAFYLVLVIALLLYKIKEPSMSKSSQEKWLCIVYMLIVMLMLMLTKTRSAWAAALGVFLVYGIFFERKYFIYIGIAALVALSIPSVQERLAEVNVTPSYWGQSGDSYEWRVTLWNSAWGWTKASALPLGYGLDSFMYHSQEFFPLAFGRDVGAHSVYRQWLFEAGIVGILCACWLYGFMIKMCWRLRKLTTLGATIIGVVLVEYLLVSYSDNMLAYLSFNWTYWFLMGTACSISYAKFGSPFTGFFARSTAVTIFPKVKLH